MHWDTLYQARIQINSNLELFYFQSIIEDYEPAVNTHHLSCLFSHGAGLAGTLWSISSYNTDPTQVSYVKTQNLAKLKHYLEFILQNYNPNFLPNYSKILCQIFKGSIFKNTIKNCLNERKNKVLIIHWPQFFKL